MVTRRRRQRRNVNQISVTNNESGTVMKCALAGCNLMPTNQNNGPS